MNEQETNPLANDQETNATIVVLGQKIITYGEMSDLYSALVNKPDENQCPTKAEILNLGAQSLNHSVTIDNEDDYADNQLVKVVDVTVSTDSTGGSVSSGSYIYFSNPQSGYLFFQNVATGAIASVEMTGNEYVTTSLTGYFQLLGWSTTAITSSYRGVLVVYTNYNTSSQATVNTSNWTGVLPGKAPLYVTLN